MAELLMLLLCRVSVVFWVALIFQNIVVGYCAQPLPTPGGSRAPTSAAPLAKRYTVNLDLPPEQRWVAVAKDHKESIVELLETLKPVLPSEVLSLVAMFGGDIDNRMPYPYGLEMAGIATAINVPISDMVLFNVLYELTAYDHMNDTRYAFKLCTSIVAQTIDGKIYHGRNMDYGIVVTCLLRDLTITVDFQQYGNTVYTGTTFVGLVGLFTGQKPNAYTISINQRNLGYWWLNVIEALMTGAHGISSFHLRDAIADKEMDFGAVVDFLANRHLIAPCYIIIGGTKAGEGVVITRTRTAAQDVWRLDPDHGRWYLVETDYDHWTPTPESDRRRDLAIKAMEETTRAGLNAASLFKVMSTPQVLSNRTTSTVIMSAAMPDAYNSWVRSDAPTVGKNFIIC